jgi:hypothetical protein
MTSSARLLLRFFHFLVESKRKGGLSAVANLGLRPLLRPANLLGPDGDDPHLPAADLVGHG